MAMTRSTGSRGTRGGVYARATAAMCLFIGGGACDSKSRQRWEEYRRTPEQWLDVALESEQADDRRRAVDAIAGSRAAGADWAVKAFDTIARTDRDAMVRVAAVRGLRRSAGPRTVPLLVKLLARGEPPPDVRPAPAVLRWEAMRLLRDLARGGQVTDDQREAVVGVLLDRADVEPDRNVRIAAIEALGAFAERRVVLALISTLRERDFALQAAAEDSLHRLTGQRHDYDADVWSNWLASAGDPFGRG